MVPPTVEVRVGGPRGQPASLQLWIDNTIMLKEMKAKHLEPPDPVKWNRQLHRVYVFDDLVANNDENEGNLETGALDALFRRCDAIVKGLEALAKKKGEAAVFVPSD